MIRCAFLPSLCPPIQTPGPGVALICIMSFKDDTQSAFEIQSLSWGCGDGKSGRCLNTDQVLTWSYKDSGYTKRCAGSDKHKSFGLRLSQSSAGDSLNNVTLSCCLLTLTLRGQDGLGGGLGSPPSPLPPPPWQSPVPNSGSGSPSRHGGRPWCGTAACWGPRGFSRLHGLRHDRPKPCSPSRLQQRPSRDLPFAALTLTEPLAPALPRAGTALPCADITAGSGPHESGFITMEGVKR